MRLYLVATFAVLAIMLQPASAAGPDDGVWVGESTTDLGRCPHRYEVRATIRNGRVRGTMVTGFERFTINTAVDDHGRVGPILAHNGRTVVRVLSGRLGPTSGTLSWTMLDRRFADIEFGDTCQGRVMLRRVAE